MAETVLTDSTVEAPPSGGGDFGWVADFGLDSVDAPQTPLPTDAEQPAGADKQELDAEAGGQDADRTDEAAEKPKETAAADGDAAQEKKPGKESAEASAAEQGEVKAKPKTARFKEHFKNPDKPIKEVKEYFESLSPARTNELKQQFINEALAEPAQFMSEVYQGNKERYGKMALAAFEADPDYFLSAGAKRDGLTFDQVTKALDFYEQNQGTAGQLNGSTLAEVLTDDVMTDLREWFPEVAGAIDNALKQTAAQPAAKPAEELATKATPVEGDAAKPDEKKAAVEPPDRAAELNLKREQDDVWTAADTATANYAYSHADKQYGLTVTDKERELNPEVADAKDEKRNLLFMGREGVLPSFNNGLFEWGKAREDFGKAVKQVMYFADKREKDNAIEAAEKLLNPIIDKYMQERLRHPIFQRYDARIERAAKGANPPTDAEIFIPGVSSPSSQQSESSDPDARISKWLVDDALNS